uniref:Uncharacterized protein n=1 Tax=Trichuris muris TaxID=70415 RepID=A0A5S6QDK6_TRIMR
MTVGKAAEPLPVKDSEHDSNGGQTDSWLVGVPELELSEPGSPLSRGKRFSSNRYFDPPHLTSPQSLRLAKELENCAYLWLLSYISTDMRRRHNRSNGNRDTRRVNGGTHAEGKRSEVRAGLKDL